MGKKGKRKKIEERGEGAATLSQRSERKGTAKGTEGKTEKRD